MAAHGHSVTAIDWSPLMIKRSAERALQSGVADKIRTVAMGAHELAMLDEAVAYDGIYSNLGPLNCVPDLTVVSRECARLLPRRHNGICGHRSRALGDWLVCGQTTVVAYRVRTAGWYRGDESAHSLDTLLHTASSTGRFRLRLRCHIVACAYLCRLHTCRRSASDSPAASVVVVAGSTYRRLAIVTIARRSFSDHFAAAFDG